MKQIIEHFTDNDLYTFTVMYYIIQNFPRAEVEYTFFDRNNTTYPEGFASLLQEQVNYMKNVKITDEEIQFMLDKCYYLPKWFIDTFLRGFRFDPSEVDIKQDSENHLSITIRGKWYSAIIWEMPILSCVSELMHNLNGDSKNYIYEHEVDKVKHKTLKILNYGLVLGDMGTRRRFSFEHQDIVVKEMSSLYQDNKDRFPGKFTGTSNVYLAMKYNLIPLGTMSHQICSFSEACESSFNEMNSRVMSLWAKTFHGDLGLYLYDLLGDKVFFQNFSKEMALLYSGLRVDSGDEIEQTNLINARYRELGINPQTKQVIYSNGLDIDKCIMINKYVKSQNGVIPSFGVGTNLTCDIDNVSPMNIVIKLTAARITEKRPWNDCIKLSCDKGKTLGNPEKCKYLLDKISELDESYDRHKMNS